MAELGIEKIVNQDKPDRRNISRRIPASASGMESSPFDFFEKNVRPCLVECSGVAMFVFVGCMAVQDPITKPTGTVFPGPSAVCVALAHGLTIALLIIGTGNVRSPLVFVVSRHALIPGMAGMEIDKFDKHDQPATGINISKRVSANDMESSSFDFFEKNVRPCLVECSGVAMFVFVGCMAVQDPITMPTGPSFPGPSAVCVALAHGLTIALLIIGTGNVSGGHFNPAVTLGVALSGAIKPVLAVGYVISQLVGSMVGAGLVRAVLPSKIYSDIGAGAHNLGEGVSPGGAILCEMVLTSVLVLTVLMAAVDRDDNVLAPLGIGLAVAVDILAGIATTGASMNPARSFGPAVVVSTVNSSFWTYHYVYWIGPALGAIVAATYYRLLIGSPHKRLLFRGPQGSGYEQGEI